MPMLFLVAGLGARYSIRRRGAARFVRERLLRLGVPLVFGTVVLCPLPSGCGCAPPTPVTTSRTHGSGGGS